MKYAAGCDACAACDICAACVLYAVLAAVAGIMHGRMRENGFKTGKAADLIILLAFPAVFIAADGITMWSLRGIILLYILTYASFDDITNGKADDSVSVMILILALTDIGTGGGTGVGDGSVQIGDKIAAGLLILIPTLVAAAGRGIGGADIKIAASAAVLTGTKYALAGYVSALVLACVVVPIYGKIKKTDGKKPFPMIPFLSAGFLTAYVMQKVI